MKNNELIYEVAEIIARAKRLTTEQYQAWKVEVIETTGQKSKGFVEKILETVDSYRDREAKA